MNYMRFILHMAPQAKERPRKGKNGFYTPSRTLNFENAVKLLVTSTMRKEGWKPFAEGVPLHLNILFVFKNKKKALYGKLKPQGLDLDNAVKICSDSLNTTAYHDDRQIAFITAIKTYGEHDRIEISLREITDTETFWRFHKEITK